MMELNKKGLLRKAFLAFGLLLIFILVISAIITTAQSNETEYGPQWETSCADGVCTTTIYSYEKYWHNGDNWEEISENWYECTTSQIRYCSPNYFIDVVARQDGTVTISKDGNELTMRLANFLNRNLTFNLVADGNKLTYVDVIPGYVDIEYQYLPRKLKENIVLKQRPPNLPQDNFNITFSRSGNAQFMMPKTIICDSQGICEFFRHEVRGDEIILEIPVRFLNNENITYPVYIDPTVQLNDSHIAWNGMVSEDGVSVPLVYERVDNPQVFDLGLPSFFSTKNYRGDIDWNLSSITDSANITNVTLELYVESTSSDNFLNVTHMEGDSTTYANTTGDCEGNCNFYKDMANGTIYASKSSISSSGYINLTFNSQGISDLTSALSNDKFSTGMYVANSKNMDISARDSSTASQRPKLIIVYTEDSPAPGGGNTPNIVFVSPTPSNGSTQAGNSIYVNVSSSDSDSRHYAFVDFDNDVFLWMRMDDHNSTDVFDLSSYDNDGSIDGDTFIDNSNGFWGDGAHFDGIDQGAGNEDRITINGLQGSQIFNSSFTVSVWAKLASLGVNRNLIGTENSLANETGWVIRSDGSNLIKFIVQNGSSGAITAQGSALSSNKWYHIVGVYNKQEGNIKLYLNGILNDTESSSGGYANSNKLWVGRIDLAGNRIWNGSADEIIIFNRSLTQTEILSLYNATANQYSNNFTSLEFGENIFIGYAVDTNGNRNQTEDRTVNLIQTQVTDCTTLDISNEIYTLQNNLSSTGTCLQVRAENITINGNGFSITGNNASGHFGVNATGGYNITVRNIIIDDFNISLATYGVSIFGENGGRIIVSNSTIETIDSHGSDVDVELNGTGSELGGNGGGITATDSTIGKVITYGGTYLSGLFGEGRDGGDAGDIILDNTDSDEIIAYGGDGISGTGGGEAGGDGGNVIIRDFSIDLTSSTINIQEGDGETDGAAGLLTLNYSSSFVDNNADYGNSIRLHIINSSSDGGEIKWLTKINSSELTNISSGLEISDNLAYVNNQYLDYSSNITLYGTPGSGLNNPNILKDNSLCTDCYNFTPLNSNTVIFNATGFSTYRIGDVANESLGRQAIEEGINNSIPNNLIEADRKMYVLNELNQHYLGSFDKATIKNNQTWVFNYVTSGESFTNIPSLFTIFNVWENQSLAYEEIVNQVETFINNTII